MRKLVAVLAAAACVVPALALAAMPAKNSAFRWCENQNSCPLAFETSTNGTRIKELRMYNRCARVPATFPRVRVRDTGRFRKSGTVTDVTGQELTYTIRGRFRTRRKAVGTYEIDSVQRRKECDADPERFVARRFGKAQPGV